MDYKEEIRKLRIQMAGDFDFVALALRDMGVTFRSGMDGTVKRLDESAQKSNELAQRVSELAQRVHEVAQGTDQASKNVSETARRVSYLGREMEERFNQVEGRMRLQVRYTPPRAIGKVWSHASDFFAYVTTVLCDAPVRCHRQAARARP